MDKILIIEDDKLVGNIYRNKLSAEGFAVEVALDGEQGLDMIRSFRPNLVLMDLVLPKIQGVDLIKRIRSEPEFQDMPLVILSGTYLTSIVQEAWKAGATKCLSKFSSTPKNIIESVREVLGTSRYPGAAPATAPAAMTIPAPPPAAAFAPTRLSEPVLEAPAMVSPSRRLGESEDEFYSGVRSSFIQGCPARVASFRTLLQQLLESPDEGTQLPQVHDLYTRVRSFTNHAGLAGMTQVAQIGEALEALLRELNEKPARINASTLRTSVSAVDLLGVLFERSLLPDDREPRSVLALVVDDDPISRRAITSALRRARLRWVCVEDPKVAYKILAENEFELILLDINMPGMGGHELCSRLRALPAHQKTPVIFVTGLNDFETKIQSVTSGGNDLIAKPFLFVELALKSLVLARRAQIEAAGGGSHLESRIR
jgi:DNA-binding response OmpR family regulator